MQDTLKQEIIAAAEAYRVDKGMDQKAFAKFAGVNYSYYNVVRGGKFVYGATVIDDAFFRTIARAIGFQLETIYWPHRDTAQYVDVMTALHQAREKIEPRMIVGETGCGKTYAIDRFCEQNPIGVYRVTVTDYDTIRDILEEVVKTLGIKIEARRGALLRGVCAALREQAAGGRKVMLIIDEAENTKVPGLKAYKALYDLLKDFAALVLVGTPELPEKLETLRRKGVAGIPQFIRRFKAKTTRLEAVDRSFPDFRDTVADAGVWRLASRLCDNYGELYDYLEPALREAREGGEELTEQAFREMYNLSKAM